MGAVNAYRAEHASSGGVAQLRMWRAAKEWYEKSLPRFDALSKQITLDYPDRTPLDEATAGLKRSAAEVARLERASAR
jgi:hypothetical protein